MILSTLSLIPIPPGVRIYVKTVCVEGETLRERIARGPMAVAAVIEMTEQVASALKAAHSAGIVHRDIKLTTS